MLRTRIFNLIGAEPWTMMLIASEASAPSKVGKGRSKQRRAAMSEPPSMEARATVTVGWRDRACHEPMRPNKMMDPETHDCDRSVELLQAGVRAAQGGDLETGKRKIAATHPLDQAASQLGEPNY